MHKLIVSITSLAVLVTVAGVGSADTACTSAASCGRYVACPPGAEKVTSGSDTACKVVIPADTDTPTCSAHNLMNDWKWSASAKKCKRSKTNGDEVFSDENIACKDDYAYKSSSGKCERASKTVYYRPVLSTATSSAQALAASSYSSATCAVGPSCATGFKLESTNGKYHCEKTEGGSAVAPTCSAHNLMNDWKWSASAKKCKRSKNNGDDVFSTENIECASGYAYSSSDGTCKKPGGTYYASPTLK